MAGFNENADKKIKISSKPNAVTIEAIKEVQQMKIRCCLPERCTYSFRIV